jgi:hypothetical protein
MHVYGAMDEDTSDAALDALLDELETADAEHPDVSVKHESEWCVSVSRSARVVWENVEEGEPRHMEGVQRQEARRLLGLVARGELSEMERQNWRPGYSG